MYFYLWISLNISFFFAAKLITPFSAQVTSCSFKSYKNQLFFSFLLVMLSVHVHASNQVMQSLNTPAHAGEFRPI